jgi:glutamate-1-semialdehyde 2,1-aminomutase
VWAAVPDAGSLNRVGSLLQYVPADGGTGLHGTGGRWGQILEAALRNGVLFMPSGKVFLSAAHTTPDVHAVVAAVSRALQLQTA